MVSLEDCFFSYFTCFFLNLEVGLRGFYLLTQWFQETPWRIYSFPLGAPASSDKIHVCSCPKYCLSATDLVKVTG